MDGLREFFDLTENTEVQVPMYGLTHLITVLGLVGLFLLIILQKDNIKKLMANTRLVDRFLIGYLVMEAGYWSLIWGYRIEPFYERFPFHLCGSLSLLMPILILSKNRKLVRFFSYWSISAGFISYANPGFVFYDALGWGFFHYLIRHYFLFLAPIVCQLGWDLKHSYREFLVSMSSLAGYAFLIFLVDWATGANYMHLGQHNPLEVPFLPRSFTIWPYSYPSFVAVGVLLLHLAYLGFRRLERLNGKVVPEVVK